MPTQQQLDAIRSARRQLDLAEDGLYAARQRAQRALNPSDSSEIAEQVAAATRRFDVAKSNLDQRIKAALGTGDFRNKVGELSADVPIVLFPVRIETRFVGGGNERELWVRVYPDDIHIHSFESRLTDDEVIAGKGYWEALVKANTGPDDAREEAKQAAWQALSSAPGVQRALWIAKQTEPENWTPTLAADPADLEFPELKDTKTHAWTRAPRSQLLPDRFVVSLYKGSRVVAHQVGRAVPDTVFMGPDPFLAEEAFKESGRSIKLDDSFAWISDFNKAVTHGLGFKIKISDAMLNHGRIDRVSVVGVMVSADPAEGKRLLAEQIAAHRYSSKGFSLLEQGTATNNTDRVSSPYQKNYDEMPKGYYDGRPEPTIADLRTSDGSELCRALGLDTDTLFECRNANKEEFRQAVAMNEALYPATIGHFLEVLTAPAVHRSAFSSLRTFFTRHVAATGPLSSVRVGDQPYGVLLTSDLRRWKEPDTDAFSTRLVNALRALQGKWNVLVRSKVAHVNKSGDASKLMLEILGLSPGSVTFRQRLGPMNDPPMSSVNVSNIAPQVTQKQNHVMALFRQLGYRDDGFPLVSSISFYRDRSRISNRNMVDRKEPSPTRFLDRLGTAKINFIQWLSSEQSLANIENHRMQGAKPPRSVLYFLLRHSLLLSLQRAGHKLYKEKGLDFTRRAHEKSLHNFDSKVQDLTGWELLKGKPSKVDAQALAVDKALGDHLLELSANASAVRALGQVRRAMKSISRLSTARLHQLLADHVDLASYRLDAWHIGLFYRRLLAKRRSNPDGVYIGAYGFVENVRPQGRTSVSVPEAIRPPGNAQVHKLDGNAGFVHTPSLNHATAAGVLFAGYKANANKGHPERYEVNLSSERVRRALHLYQGVQNDQPIEALLGYQFERALHERTTATPGTNLNQYIYELREKFPIEGASLPQAGSEAQENIPVYPVVNGLSLIEAKRSELLGLGIPSDDVDILQEEIDRLDDAVDAIGDLLTAETAYQLVQGKMDRTAGVLNSFRDLNVPPDLEVHKTPRSTEQSVSNRLCLGFANRPGIPAGSGWGPRLSPRSTIEPGINSWLAGQLGDPAKIVCHVQTVVDGTASNRETITVADLGIQPIDFVYAVGTDVKAGAKEVEQLVVREYSDRHDIAPDAELRIEYQPPGLARSKRSFAEVLPHAGYLRSLITTGRPANATDFEPSRRDDTRPLDDRYGWDADDLRGRVEDALAALESAVATVGAKAPNARQPKTERNPATLQEFFEGYLVAGAPSEWLTGLHLTSSAIRILEEFVATATQFGIRIADPGPATSDPSWDAELLGAAVAAWIEALARIRDTRAKIEAAAAVAERNMAIKRLVEAGAALFGDDFVVIPGFFFSNASEVRSSLQDGNEVLLRHYAETYGTSPRLAMDTWLQSLGPVRENCKRLEVLRTVSEFNGGDKIELTAMQLPYKDGDHWLAVEYPTVDENGERIERLDDTRTVCMSGVNAADSGRRQQILVIDEWTEAIPTDGEVTGIAYNYNQPNSSAPNAILLAVEPTNDPAWSWESLLGTVDDTLDRAKARAVEPTHLDADPQLDILTPMTIAGFDLNESNLSLDYLAVDDELAARMKANNYSLYTGLD